MSLTSNELINYLIGYDLEKLYRQKEKVILIKEIMNLSNTEDKPVYYIVVQCNIHVV